MIPIYKAEIDANIADQIQASASFGILATIEPCQLPFQETDIISLKQHEKCKEIFTGLAEANPDQFDLYYLQSVLVSVGWNNNDDVFDRYETWNARATPVDKPFNYMHDPKDIIGHMTSARVISEGNIVSFDTPLDDVPEVFDIVVGSVLYRSWSDTDLQERMDKIIADIPSGSWKVSMECLFRNFDYAVITPQGDNQIIKRNESSAFLTKHLRIYGGTGTYQDCKVGRLLRNYAFSGKGLVEQPANPKSDITGYSDQGEVRIFSYASEASIDILDEKVEETMSENTYTQDQYSFLKDELDSIKASLIEKDNEIVNLNKQIATLNETKESDATLKTKESDKIVAEKDKEILDLNSKLEKVEASFKTVQDEIDQVKAEAVKAARLADLLKRDVTEDKAKSLLEKFSDVSDEMFTELVSALPEKVEVTETTGTEETDETEETQSDLKSVEDGKVEDANLSLADETKNACTAAASWLSGSILKSTAGLKEEN